MQISMQINSKCSRKWVYRYCPTRGKVTTAVYSRTDRQVPESHIPWWVTVRTRYKIINSGHRSNFLRIDLQKDLKQHRLEQIILGERVNALDI